MSYFIFLTFSSYSVLLKIYQHTKSNLTIYNLSMLKKIDFSSSLLFKENDQHWKTFQVVYNMTMFRKNLFPTYQLWHHNILYLAWYFIFPAFWSHSVKIGQYTKSNLMIYNFSMFRKRFLWWPLIRTSLVSRQRGP